MKHNWEIKKLEDIADINYGTRIVQKVSGGFIYPVYGGGGATFKSDDYNREDCLIVSRFAMSKQCTRRVVGKFFLNDSGLTIVPKNNSILQSFLDVQIIGLNDKIYSLGKGAAQRNLDIKELKKLKISFPKSIETQQTIVKELDLLSTLINKQKAQLTELDRLAQSVFYDMFGDPVENEKGWEVKKLGELSEKIGDGLHGTPEYSENSEYYFINGNNLIEGDIIISALTQCVSKSEYEKHYIKFNDKTLFVSINGTIGKVAYYKDEKVILGKSACYIILQNDCILKTFLYALLRSDYFREYASKEKTGSTISNVSLKSMRNMPIILPPLTLQQQFAATIEKIEAQKALVKQSIAQSEQLLASRMQYYFE